VGKEDGHQYTAIAPHVLPRAHTTNKEQANIIFVVFFGMKSAWPWLNAE
jgi:hypothetical protein